MAGSAVFSMGSTSVSFATPPSFSQGSPILEWTLLGGWTSGLFFVNCTAFTAGAGPDFPSGDIFIGLAPIDPATGNWADVYPSPSGYPVPPDDGGYIKVTGVGQSAKVLPINGNAYEIVYYGNPSSSCTLSASLILSDR